MGQRLGRDRKRGEYNSTKSSPPEIEFDNRTISTLTLDNRNNNKSVVITIRMLKMEPTEQQQQNFCGCNQTTSCYHLDNNDNNNLTTTSNSICDNNKQIISKINHQNSTLNNHINDFSSDTISCTNSKLKNNNFGTTNQLGNNLNIISSSTSSSSTTSPLQIYQNDNDIKQMNKLSNLNIIDDEMSINCLRLGLGSSGGQLIKQSNNYDQHILNGNNNMNNFSTCLNNLGINDSSNEYFTNKELNIAQTIEMPSERNILVNEASASTTNSNSCDSCRQKSKGKLCKACRSNDNENIETTKKNKENGKFKKGNWGIGRFKRNNNKSVNSNNSLALSNQNTDNLTQLNNDKKNQCLCSTLKPTQEIASENFNMTPPINIESPIVGISQTNQNHLNSTPQQLRTASLQFYPQANNIVLASTASNTIENLNTPPTISNNNNSSALVTPSSVIPANGQAALLHSNNQLLQRAAFYNGNVGGNVILLSMNQAQPLLDFSRFNPEDYPIEDCDERARIQRAVEIAEGVEPPPGFRPKIQPSTIQSSPTPQQWHMLCTPDAALQNLLNNSFVLQNNVFLSPEEIPRIHSQVDYIHCLVPDLQKITSCSFYWGKMDRYEAERLLEGKPEGTFLLRDSAQEEYLFSVSFRKYSRSLHARIEQFNHKFSFDSHDPGVYTASTVTGLLEHYKDPTCVMFFEPMLTIPLNRNFPFSLQQLCRATIVSNSTYDGINDFTLPTPLKGYLKEYHYKQRVRVRCFDDHTYVNS